MVYHKSASNQYNPIIDRNLIKLIQSGINLKDLFDSEILFYRIDQKVEMNSADNLLYGIDLEYRDDVLEDYYNIT